MTTPEISLPKYWELIYPVLCAVRDLGGSARAREIVDRVVEDTGASDEQLAVTYESRPMSKFIDRIHWACSYAKLGGALDRPQRGLFVLTTMGREILALPQAEAVDRIVTMDRQIRASRLRRRGEPGANNEAVEEEDDEVPPLAADEEEAQEQPWTEALLGRLHRLGPEGFEEFVMYLLRTFDLELTRVGGSGDQGIDGIGIAPISPVLSSRVAVQAKRHDPGSAIGRDVVALFQRDAAAAGAERAVLVTLARFSEPARKAAISATPTVDLIDGERLCELVRVKQIGLKIVPQVDESWFDRFDS